MKFDTYWIRLCGDAIDFARKENDRADYNQMCKSLPYNLEQNMGDKLKVLEMLIEQKVIAELDGKLRLIDKDFCFLNDHLLDGSTDAWRLVERQPTGPEIAKKFDDELRKEIGLAGENFVYDQIRNRLPSAKIDKLEHISISDDTVGYDIRSPKIDSDGPVYLEVKTSIRPGTFNFYLSRNEYKVSQKESDKWYVILVKIEEKIPKILGFIKAETLYGITPVDRDVDISKWQSVAIAVKQEWVHRGLPV
jgi:hypothetical protein